MKNWLRLLRYAWPHWRGLGVVLVTMLLSIGLNVLRPWPTKLLVDQVLGHQPIPPQVIRSLLLDALERLMEKRTTLIMAHRLSTIRNAERILVLNHGEIVEQGRHAELMALEGFYAGLYRQQMEITPGASQGYRARWQV